MNSQKKGIIFTLDIHVRVDFSGKSGGNWNGLKCAWWPVCFHALEWLRSMGGPKGCVFLRRKTLVVGGEV